MDEVVSLTNAMVETGQQVNFGDNIVDKHCIGGVAGNRTTLLIVPIIAAAGLTVPKTSSRAITSPAGTADTMEVLAKVEFELDELKNIVKKVGGCIIWGGSLNLAPADDKIIKAEYPLSIDPEGQVLASVMAKKKSVGSDYVLIDIPVGKGAKISEHDAASSLAKKFIELGKRLDMYVECIITDGSGPIGSGVGPALEARDCLLALDNKGPTDLINKSLDLAGILLELSGSVKKHKGREVAEKILSSRKAKRKMMEIIEAQGGDPEIKPDDIALGDKIHVIKAPHRGRVRYVDNKKISHIARVAGAPKDKEAGIYLHVTAGDCVKAGDPVITIYSKTSMKLQEALLVAEKLEPVNIGGVILDTLT
jgi:AMP phosphorylase